MIDSELRAWIGEPPSEEDRACIREQLGRNVQGLAGVVVRCRYGRPQVIATHPLLLDREGVTELPKGPIEPRRLGIFPTLYWLTCPLLVRAIGRLEAVGWVGRVKEEIAASEAESAELAEAHRETARIRRALIGDATWARLAEEFPGQHRVLATSGVGGIRLESEAVGDASPGVKCLHTHFADYLARGRNPVGRRVWGMLTAAGVDPRGGGDCFRAGECACPAAGDGEARRVGRPQALIDIGSNSVRLLVGRVDEAGEIETLQRALRTTRLGAGVTEEGRLAPEGVEATLEVLREFRAVADALGADEPHAWGTAALRAAADREAFAIRAWEESGCSVRVIAGEEEAALSFQGALSALRLPPTQGVLVADIGGGSTDLVLGDTSGRVLGVQSVDIGAVQLALRGGEDAPPETLRALSRPPLRKALNALWSGVEPEAIRELTAAGPLRLVGVGGTATSVAAMELQLRAYDPQRVNGATLSFERVGDWLERLAPLNPEERSQLPGLPPQRADIIVAGIVIMVELAAAFIEVASAIEPEWTIADSDLMHGVMARLA